MGIILFVCAVIGAIIATMRFVYWHKDRQQLREEKEPDISVTQDDSQRRNSEAYILHDGQVFTNASFSLSNDSLVPMQVKSFMLNDHQMIERQGQFVDRSNQFRLEDGKVMQNRAMPSIPELPCTIQPKGSQSFSVWFETPRLKVPDAGDKTVRLVVNYDKNLITSFTIFIRGYPHR